MNLTSDQQILWQHGFLKLNGTIVTTWALMLVMALGALKNAHSSSLSLMPPEIVAVDIMAAASAFGSITGEVSGEDILDAIFRDFCIGK